MVTAMSFGASSVVAAIVSVVMAGSFPEEV
jgi:hypothetical protein